MSSVIERPVKRTVKSRITLAVLRREIAALRQRVEDLEDLRELNQAIERNGTKPLVAWSRARKLPGLV